MNIRITLVPLLAAGLLLAACGAQQSAPSGEAPSTAAAPAPTTLSRPVIAASLTAMAQKLRATASGTAAAALSNRMIHVNGQRQIQVYVHVSALTPELEQALSTAGAADIRPSQPLRLYQAWVSPDALEKIATLTGVTRITPPVYGFTRPHPQ